MWGERGLISHKFEGTGEGGAGVCTEGLPRGCARVHDAAGWLHSGCELGVQLAVARWARLSAGRVHYGRAAGGCPMGQAVNWACYGYPGALPRMPDMHDMQTRSISHTKIMMMASDIAQIIYSNIIISTVLYMRISKA